MKVEHKTTVYLETEEEREHFRRAFLIAQELCNNAIRRNAACAVLIRAGISDGRQASYLRQTIANALDSI